MKTDITSLLWAFNRSGTCCEESKRLDEKIQSNLVRVATLRQALRALLDVCAEISGMNEHLPWCLHMCEHLKPFGMMQISATCAPDECVANSCII